MKMAAVLVFLKVTATLIAVSVKATDYIKNHKVST